MKIDVEVEGGVARIFLNRPEKSNALTAALLEDLAASFQDLKNEKTLRVAVLRGRGKAFSGGADVNELAALTAQNATSIVEKIHSVCQAVRSLPVPVVAAMHGACIGGALEIAAACDLRIAAEGTRFSMPEVKLGIPSVVEAALLPRLMGYGRAAWLVYTGEAIDARRAYEWGLVEEVTADLEGTLAALVRSLLAADPEALRVQKQLLQYWEDATLPASVAKSIELFGRTFAGIRTTIPRGS